LEELTRLATFDLAVLSKGLLVRSRYRDELNRERPETDNDCQGVMSYSGCIPTFKALNLEL